MTQHLRIPTDRGFLEITRGCIQTSNKKKQESSGKLLHDGKEHIVVVQWKNFPQDESQLPLFFLSHLSISWVSDCCVQLSCHIIQKQEGGKTPTDHQMETLASSVLGLNDRLTKRLALMRDRILYDISLQEEEKSWVPLLEQSKCEENPSPVFERIDRFFKGPKKVLLLLGEAGTGKTLVTQLVEKNFWTFEEKGGIPLRIDLPHFDSPYQNLVRQVLQENQFSLTDIEELKKLPFLFIFDGFDELLEYQNLFVANDLEEWKHSKIIITCRKQPLQHIPYYLHLFAPVIQDYSQTHLVDQLEIAPFNQGQIQTYVNHCPAVIHSTRPKKWYLDQIEHIPGLKKLITVPYVLQLIVHILPEIVERCLAASPDEYEQLRIVEVYRAFIDKHFEREAKKPSSLGLTENERISLYYSFCEDLANALQQAGRTAFDPKKKEWKRFFIDNNPTVQAARHAAPLKKTAKGTLSFIHPSLIHFFSSTQLNKEGEEKPSPEYSEQTVPKQGILYTQSFVNNHDTMQFFVGNCLTKQGGEKFQKWLFEILERSKVDSPSKGDVIAATNALTILVRSGYSFAYQDLSSIKVDGADLNGGIFDHANLSDASLVNSQFKNVCLDFANLENCDLSGVNFGILSPFSSEGTLLSTTVHALSSEQDFFISQEYAHLSIWDINSGKHLDNISGNFKSLRISPKGSLLLLWNEDGTSKVWSCGEDSEELCHCDTVSLLAPTFDETGETFFVLSPTHILRIESQTGHKCNTFSLPKIAHKEAYEYSGHLHYSILTYSFAIADTDTRIIGWYQISREDLIENKNIFKDYDLKGNYSLGTLFCESQTYRAIAYKRSIQVEDIQINQHLYTFKHSHDITEATFSIDGTILAIKDQKDYVILIHSTSGKQLGMIENVSTMLHPYLFTNDSKCIVLGHLDNTLIIWDWTSNKKIHTFIHRHPIKAAYVLAKHQQIIAIDAKCVHRHPLSLLEENTDEHTFHKTELITATLLKQTPKCISVSQNGQMLLWNTKTGKTEGIPFESPAREKQTLMVQESAISKVPLAPGITMHHGPTAAEKAPLMRRLCISHDQTQVVGIDDTSTLLRWNIHSKKLESMHLTPGNVYNICFSSDGHHLCAFDRNGHIDLYHVADLSPVYSHQFIEGFITATCLLPNKGQMVVATGKNNVYLIDIPSLESTSPYYHLLEMKGVKQLICDEENTLLFIGGYEKIAIWNLATMSQEKEIDQKGQVITALAYLSHQHLLCIADSFGGISLYDINQVEKLTSFRAHPTQSNWISATREGTLLTSDQKSGNIRCWDCGHSRPKLLWQTQGTLSAYEAGGVHETGNILKKMGAKESDQKAFFMGILFQIQEGEISDKQLALMYEIVTEHNWIDIFLLMQVLDMPITPQIGNQNLLHFALFYQKNHATGTYRPLVKLLLEANEDPNQISQTGLSPVHIAAAFGFLDYLQLLAENKGEMAAPSREGKTPLMLSAAANHVECVRFLLSQDGVQIDATDAEQSTALYQAVCRGHFDCVQLLVAAGSDVDHESGNGGTPLLEAAQSGPFEVLELLLQNGANVNHRDPQGYTPAVTAAQEGRLACLKKLHEAGADLTVCLVSKNNATYLAAQGGHLPCLQYLHEHGADINQPNNQGATPVYVATVHNRTTCLTYLAEQGADLNKEVVTTQRTPIDAAVRFGHAEVLSILCEHGVDLSGRDIVANAVLDGSIDCVRVLVKYHADCNQGQHFLPLNMAINKEDLELVKLLMEGGAKCPINGEEVSPLFVATENGNLEILQYLIEEQQISPHNVMHKRGLTLAHTAALNGHIDCLKYFHAKGLPLATIAEDKDTPLHLAASEGYLECVRFLVEHGENQGVIDLPGNQNNTPLYNAVRAGSEECLRYLHEQGGDINKPCYRGYRPLHMVAQTNSIPCAQYLLSKGAELNPSSSMGFTPVYLAAQNGHPEILAFLAEQGADLSLTPMIGYSCVHIAAKHGHFECLKVLQTLGVDFDQSSDGTTHINIQLHPTDPSLNYIGDTNRPIYYAAEQAHIKCMQLILEELKKHERDVDTERMVRIAFEAKLRIETPSKPIKCPPTIPILHKCVAFGFEDLLTMLFDGMPDIDVDMPCDEEHRLAPLHFAALSSQLSCIDFLLEKGALVDQEDANTMTPLALALAIGSESTVKKLTEANADMTHPSVMKVIESGSVGKMVI